MTEQIKHCLTCQFEPEWNYVSPCGDGMMGECGNLFIGIKDEYDNESGLRKYKPIISWLTDIDTAGHAYQWYANGKPTLITNCPAWQPKQSCHNENPPLD